MSKVAIVGDPSGTGTFTISAPNGNTDRTLVLPDEAGTVLTSVSGLTAGNLTGSVPASAMPAGSVIQVVQSSYATQSSTTSTTYVATGLSGTITPTSSTSKILVQVSANFQSGGSVNNNITLYRGTTSGTDLSGTSGGVGFGYVNAQTQASNQIPSITYLDSPSTTSAVTYTVAYRVSGGTMYTCVGNAPSTITLTEISA